MRQMKTHETQDNGEIKFPKDTESDGILSKYQQICLREEKRNIHLDNGNSKNICRLNLGGKHHISLQLSTPTASYSGYTIVFSMANT